MNEKIQEQRGIYFIRIGNYGYVGQTVNFNNRLSSHIREAYYGFDKKEARELYWKMKIHRIQDLEITIYPESINFGIPNFEEKLSSFLEEWEPEGKRVAKDSSISDGTIKLDFAEIYHILYHLSKGDCTLTNLEIGGQAVGWTSRKEKLKSQLSTKGGNIKLITRQTPPKEAYQTFLKGAAAALDVASITEQIYFDVFDEKWKTILNNKYQPLIRAFFSQTDWKEIVSIGKNLPSWSQFVAGMIDNYITPNLSSWVVESLNKKGVKTTSSVRAVAQEKISKYIIRNFIKPRERIVNTMFKVLFIQSGKFPSTAARLADDKLDFRQLGDYLADAIKMTIVQIDNDFSVTSNKTHIQNKQKMKPIRTSVVWDTGYNKSHANSTWIQNLSIDTGQLIDEKWLKYRSFLLFDRLIKEAKVVDVYQEPKKTKAFDGRRYVPMYFLEHANWLSTRLNNIYKEYAPGYTNNWLEFYRPMVSLWRSYHNRPDFNIIKNQENNTDYLGYESTEDDVLIVYTNIKNFEDEIANLDQIKIY